MTAEMSLQPCACRCAMTAPLSSPYCKYGPQVYAAAVDAVESPWPRVDGACLRCAVELTQNPNKTLLLFWLVV